MVFTVVLLSFFFFTVLLALSGSVLHYLITNEAKIEKSAFAVLITFIVIISLALLVSLGGIFLLNPLT